MLAVGMLSYDEIAREAGVSATTVGEIALGRRMATMSAKPSLNPGDRFERVPIRCPECGASIYISPCLACREAKALRQAQLQNRNVA
jgi:predicted RNA-binding Zn-ribbon protein involved in translation (DUF1610 family)